MLIRGRSPHPSRRGDQWGVPLGSTTVVYRNLGPDEEGYHPDTAGSYDIPIKNNYAEYGTT